MPKMIRFNHVADEYPMYINADTICAARFYFSPEDQCWKILLELKDGDGYCEWQEDNNEKPLAEHQAEERFQFILNQIEGHTPTVLFSALH